MGFYKYKPKDLLPSAEYLYYNFISSILYLHYYYGLLQEMTASAGTFRAGLTLHVVLIAVF